MLKGGDNNHARTTQTAMALAAQAPGMTYYYYHGRSGDSFVDATIHYREDCPDLEEPIRPIGEGSVDIDSADTCTSCEPLGNDSDVGGDEPETCQVVKTDGEVCGRDRPCQYHD